MKSILDIISYTCTSKIAPKMEAQLVPCKRCHEMIQIVWFLKTQFKKLIYYFYISRIYSIRHSL